MKINKKNYKILSCTGLVLLITMSSTYNTSHSKFIEQKDYAFVYRNQLQSLFQAGKLKATLNLGRSEKNTAFFDIKLTRNSDGIGKKDTYTFDTMDSGCKLLDNDGESITFESSQTNSEVNLTATCPVKDNDISLTISVNEKIGNEDTFNYTTFSDTIKKATFESYFQSVETTMSNLYEVVDAWLTKNYYDTTGIKGDELNELKNDVEKYLASYKSIKITDGNFSSATVIPPIEGINIKYDGTSESFKIDVDKNFISYAKTNASVSSPESAGFKKMYFYSEDSSEINSLFLYYLNEYGNYYLGVSASEVANAIKTIEAYLNSIDKLKNNGKYDITKIDEVDDGVNGLFWFNKPDTKIKVLVIDDLYNAAQSSASPAIKNPASNNVIAENSISNNNLVKKSVISDKLKESLSNDDNALKNSFDKATTSKFNDYFIIYDDDVNYNRYVIANVYNSDLKNNIVSLIPINVTKTGNLKIDEITFKNNGDDLEVSLKIKNSSSQDAVKAINNFVGLLEKNLNIVESTIQHGGTYGKNNDSILISNDNTISLTFNITKVV